MANPSGNIIIHPGTNVWPHEMRTAKAFASRGYDVFFPAVDNNDYHSSPDAIIFNLVWEMKSPRSPKMSKILKVVREAVHQSPNVIYDSQRIKNLTDTQIEHELRRVAPMLKALNNLLFMDRRRHIVIIKQAQKFDI